MSVISSTFYLLNKKRGEEKQTYPVGKDDKLGILLDRRVRQDGFGSGCCSGHGEGLLYIYRRLGVWMCKWKEDIELLGMLFSGEKVT